MRASCEDLPEPMPFDVLCTVLDALHARLLSLRSHIERIVRQNHHEIWYVYRKGQFLHI